MALLFTRNPFAASGIDDLVLSKTVCRPFRAGDMVNPNPGLTPGAMVWRAFGAGEGQPPEVGIVRHWFEVV